jgi:radical SAM superfamily enzyme YgiQ (UPF0313 family)
MKDAVTPDDGNRPTDSAQEPDSYTTAIMSNNPQPSRPRVLLILPPDVNIIEPFRSAGYKQDFLVGFPIGLGYIAAYLREKANYDVRIVDGSAENLTLDQLCAIVKEYDPQYIGMTLYTRTVKVAIALARRIREQFPDKILIAGGPHASDDYENLLTRYPVFDYIVVGEGEVTMLELLNALEAGRTEQVGAIPGLAFLDRNTRALTVTTARPYVTEIDSIPPPARDLVDFNRYIRGSNLLPYAVEIMGSRGCTHRCAFCSFQRKWRARAPEAIVAEMKELLKRYPQTRSFQFFDDNFSVSRERVMKLCELLIREGLNRYVWSALCRADQVDLEMLRTMKKAGCTKVMFGVESAVPEILEKLNKHLDLKRVQTALRDATRADLDALAFFIIGNPGETRETIQTTYRFAKRLRCRSTAWGIMCVYPGTALAKLQPCDDFVSYLYEPEIRKPGPAGTNPNIPVFENPGLGREEVKTLFEKIYRRITLYKALTHPLFTLRKLSQNPAIATGFLKRLASRGKS